MLSIEDIRGLLLEGKFVLALRIRGQLDVEIREIFEHVLVSEA